mmetsp:Transcript_4768/g.13251  ORF Transcript_4768/g.13251 Transcript_4768/m.13251 type:complete len:393 (-) Transcript_4768:735-1913(-)
MSLSGQTPAATRPRCPSTARTLLLRASHSPLRNVHKLYTMTIRTAQRRRDVEVAGQRRRTTGHATRPATDLLKWSPARPRGQVACTGAIRDVEPASVKPPPGTTVSETKIYSWREWDRHRSTGRYWRHIQSIPTSSIVKGLLPPMLWVCFVALLVGLYETASESGVWPILHLPHLSVIYKPFEITGFALGLLLVFRTDASYSRYQSARHNWKGIITYTREIMRLGGVYGTEETEQKLATWTSIYAWCCLFHMTSPDSPISCPLEERLAAILPQRELEAVLDPSIRNRPMFVLAVLTELISQIEDSSVRGTMLGAVTQLEASLADCERILKTPIPVSYTRHTSRFLISYLTFLPFALWQETSWGLLPISGIVAFFLLGIDEIGVRSAPRNGHA